MLLAFSLVTLLRARGYQIAGLGSALDIGQDLFDLLLYHLFSLLIFQLVRVSMKGKD